MTRPEADLSRLREVAAGATAGPWHVCESPEWHDDLDGQAICGPEHEPVAAMADEWYEDEDGEPTAAIDAEFIATARNEWDGLLDEVEALRQERDHWKSHAEEAGRGFAQVCRDYARVSATVARVWALADTEWLCATASDDALHPAVPVEHLRAALTETESQEQP